MKKCVVKALNALYPKIGLKKWVPKNYRLNLGLYFSPFLCPFFQQQQITLDVASSSKLLMSYTSLGTARIQQCEGYLEGTQCYRCAI